MDCIGNFIKGLNAVDTEELLHGVHDADAWKLKYFGNDIKNVNNVGTDALLHGVNNADAQRLNYFGKIFNDVDDLDLEAWLVGVVKIANANDDVNVDARLNNIATQLGDLNAGLGEVDT